jgi:hypothetical protein
MKRSGRLHKVKVGADGNGVVSPAGSALPRELAAESPGSVVGAFGEPEGPAVQRRDRHGRGMSAVLMRVRLSVALTGRGRVGGRCLQREAPGSGDDAERTGRRLNSGASGIDLWFLVSSVFRDSHRARAGGMSVDGVGYGHHRHYLA